MKQQNNILESLNEKQPTENHRGLPERARPLPFPPCRRQCRRLRRRSRHPNRYAQSDYRKRQTQRRTRQGPRLYPRNRQPLQRQGRCRNLQRQHRVRPLQRPARCLQRRSAQQRRARPQYPRRAGAGPHPRYHRRHRAGDYRLARHVRRKQPQLCRSQYHQQRVCGKRPVVQPRGQKRYRRFGGAENPRSRRHRAQRSEIRRGNQGGGQQQFHQAAQSHLCRKRGLPYLGKSFKCNGRILAVLCRRFRQTDPALRRQA